MQQTGKKKGAEDYAELVREGGFFGIVQTIKP